jgi:predicted MFS family arabinose efflux permease
VHALDFNDDPGPHHDLPHGCVKNAANQTRVIVASLAAAAIGVVAYNVLPLLLGSMQDGHGLSASGTGLLGTAFFFGFNLSGISAIWWIRRVHWRVVCVALIPMVVVTLAATLLFDEIFALAGLTALCGAASGAIYAVGTVIIGDTSQPERWLGVKTALESAAGVLLLFALPVTLSVSLGPSGTVWGMILMVMVLAPALLFLPDSWPRQQPEGTGFLGAEAASTNIFALACALLALLALFAGASAIWAFAERIGAMRGFDAGAVSGLLGVTLSSGIVGSLLVGAVGSQIRAWLGMVIGLVLILLAIGLLASGGSFLVYGLGNCLYMFGWSIATPLAVAEVARLDLAGRFAALVVPAIGTGSMIGPGAAGWLLEVGTAGTLLAFVAGAIIAAGVLIVLAARGAASGRLT